MISAMGVTKSLYGAYRLARADRDGMSYLDTSLDGFWQSFFAAFLVAPIFFLLLIIRFNVGVVETPAFRFLAIEGISYIIGWVLFPLIIYYLVQALDREQKFIGFIVAYNWASAIQNGIYLPFAILFELGIISGAGAGFINFFLLCLVLAYTWFVAKTALDVSGLIASGLVVLDVGLWIMINILTESMLLSQV